MTLAYLTPSPPPLPPQAAAITPPAQAASGPGEAPSRRFKRTCAECGTPFLAAKRWGEFCSAEHRKTFNNRRLTRGAEIYDLFMCLRNERPLATALGVWKLLCRLAQAYREEDERERAGRRSWRDPKQMLAERPWLRADRLGTYRWKKPNVGGGT